LAIVVRQATTADLDALVPLFDAYRVFYRKTSDPELARTFLAERLSRNQSVVFLALRGNGAAVGFTQLYPSFSSAAAAPVFILNDLFVAPDARRNGRGSVKRWFFYPVTGGQVLCFQRWYNSSNQCRNRNRNGPDGHILFNPANRRRLR